MNKILFIIIALSLASLGIYAFISNNATPSADISSVDINMSYTSVSFSELENMLASKDFKLIDVHTPEQEHISGTDAVIPYNQIDKIAEFSPDKNEKIVLYCRSGSMSKIAADELTKLGYKNIYNLEGGIDAWLRAGKETMLTGSVNNN